MLGVYAGYMKLEELKGSYSGSGKEHGIDYIMCGLKFRPCGFSLGWIVVHARYKRNALRILGVATAVCGPR